MGQNKLDKSKDNKAMPVKNPIDKKHKGDTERSSDQGRKDASGGSSDTNNQGRPKGA